MVCGQKHGEIIFNNSHYAILYKYMFYFITKFMLGVYNHVNNNVIVGVPRPWTFFLYIYFSKAHPLFYVRN